MKRSHGVLGDGGPLRRPEHDQFHRVTHENAAAVNALQRRADVVGQKSLVEGFGLPVTEAIWKARPVMAHASAGSRTRSRAASTGSWSILVI